ncbi:MAG TPA: hypothetical protein VIP09_13125 [Dehalococcoidia bacterium]
MIRREFNFEWVASNGEGLVAHSDDLRAVIEEVRNRGPVSSAVFTYVNFERLAQ